MSDGDLVKVEIVNDEIVSIVKVDSRVEATHVIDDSWNLKDFSSFGLTFDPIVYHFSEELSK